MASAAARAAKIAVGIAISALFLWVTLAAVPFAEVAKALAVARPEWILAALAFAALAYLLKIARWTLMLRRLGAEVSLRQAATPFLGGVAFNNILPLRAGDLIRVVAAERFTGVPPSGQVGTLVLERLLDLAVLMAILFATITLWPIEMLDATILHGLRLAALGVLAAILLFILAPAPTRIIVRWGERRLSRLPSAGAALLSLSNAVQTLCRPGFLTKASALSFAAWLAEGCAYLAVGYALGIAASPEAALLALSIGTLSTIIPSSPGYVGTFHFFTARAVAAFGATSAGAAAYAILIHALLWIATTAAGFLLLARSGLAGRLLPAKASS